MAGLFQAIGALFTGFPDKGSGYQWAQQPPQIQMPQVQTPAPVEAPPTKTPDTSVAAAFGQQRGQASTILTSGLGDTSALTTQKKKLLGA